MSHLMTSDAARRGGVNLETIRYYERRGLLTEAMRKALDRLAAACAGRGSVSDCPILESLDLEDDDHGN